MKSFSVMRFFLKWVIGLTVVACASMPPIHFHVLEPLPAPVKTFNRHEPKRIIGVGPVTLAALLERKQLVTRTADNLVQLSEQHQWAAPLRENITQTLTENLGTLLAGDLVKAYPWSAYGEVDYRLLVDIGRFDTTPGQSVNLEANWALMAEKNHTILRHGQVKISRPLADISHAASVKALSDSLNEFSRQLAVAVESVP